MSVKQVNPYINFNGESEKAIKLYESALGAKVESLMHWGDVKEMPCPPENKNRVMHAALRIGEGLIMLGDAPPDQPAPPAGNIQISLQFSALDGAPEMFGALAAGGKVTMPLRDMFWGAKFGMLTDAFGVHWMFNCELKKT